MSEIVDSLSSITETSDVFIIQNGGNIIENNPTLYANGIIFSINIVFILFIIYIIFISIYK